MYTPLVRSVFQREGAARLKRVASLAGVLANCCSACASEAAPPHELGRRSADVIGGELAAAAELNHTGALVAIDPVDGQPGLFCTATLIGPETVVTAKHCTLRFAEYEAEGLQLAWLVGPAVSATVEMIPIVAVQVVPESEGGFLGIGPDVAIAHLEHPTAIPPALPSLLTQEELGQSMLSLGYGIFTPEGARDGQRRIGHETLVATEGKLYQAIFRSFENFVEWSLRGEVTEQDALSAFTPGNFFDELLLGALLREFDGPRLLDGQEAVTGGEAGDTQTCFGDSGGPLARRADTGVWQIYGVVSGGLYSARSVCDYGTVIATFGTESLAFVRAALDWVDPCGDVSAPGECRGSAELRCETNLGSGRRELVQRDCAALGLGCVSSRDGAACSGSLERSDAGGAAPPSDTSDVAPPSDIADAAPTEAAPPGDAPPSDAAFSGAAAPRLVAPSSAFSNAASR